MSATDAIDAGRLSLALTDLRLVRPRDGWPNPDAVPMSAGSTEILDNAKVFRTTEDAIADLNYVVATTARQRGMVKPVLPPQWLKNVPAKNVHINPTGKFVIGGPVGDCGPTRRQIIVYGYGGWARHAGGACSATEPLQCAPCAPKPAPQTGCA